MNKLSLLLLFPFYAQCAKAPEQTYISPHPHKLKPRHHSVELQTTPISPVISAPTPAPLPTPNTYSKIYMCLALSGVATICTAGTVYWLYGMYGKKGK